MRFQIIILIGLTMSIFSCNQEESNLETIKYYVSWGGYSIPKKPQQEIDIAEIDNYSTYHKAYYKGKLLVKFEKYIDGKLDWSDEYIYWENSKKLKMHILVNALGEKRIHSYSKQGKQLPNEN